MGSSSSQIRQSPLTASSPVRFGEQLEVVQWNGRRIAAFPVGTDADQNRPPDHISRLMVYVMVFRFYPYLSY